MKEVKLTDIRSVLCVCVCVYSNATYRNTVMLVEECLLLHLVPFVVAGNSQGEDGAGASGMAYSFISVFYGSEI